MTDLLTLVESLQQQPVGANGKSALAELGFIACAQTIDIKHVPFFEPCLLLILAGRKTLFDAGEAVHAQTGELFAVPGPASFDMRNEPDARSRKYRALVIPFNYTQLQDIRTMHALSAAPHAGGVLKFARNAVRDDAIAHYLHSLDDVRLRTHRLMEILLILATADARLLSLAQMQATWSQRVRSLVATDLTRTWDIADVCRRLATSESSLRRNLKREHAGFRELVNELRLSSALTQLLQTSRPIYQIAYDCGYHSVSRFSNNFHKRFGLPPRDLREAADSEQNLAVSERFPAL